MSKHPFVRLLWRTLGAAVAISLALWIAGLPEKSFLLASLGGSTVFLFGLTRAPTAQSRALFGGHLSGAFIGIACYQAFGDSISVYIAATVLTFCFMLITRTVHPPAGANSIIMIQTNDEWLALWQPGLLGVGSLFLVAIIWSRLYPGLVHYPASPMEPSPPSFGWSD